MGFITYQLINPGYISWWVSLWMNVGRLIDFKAASWISASLCSFFVAAAATLVGGGVARITRRPRDRRHPT
jgi:hypothetical protein